MTARTLNGDRMAKQGPWKGSKVLVESMDVGDGFEVPCWVLLHPAGGWAVIRMAQGKEADRLRDEHWQMVQDEQKREQDELDAEAEADGRIAA